MRTRRMAALLAAGELAAGLGAGMTGIAHGFQDAGQLLELG